MTTAVDSVVKLVDQLRQYRLLEPAQLTEVGQTLQGRYTDPRPLAQELLKRGWLTPFQVNQLFQGRGQDLVLGQYVVLDRLGEGATGQVFKARHHRMRRLAALKVIRPELLAQTETVGRFYREIEAISRLSHAHIVEGYDAGPANLTHFFAMEYVEGIDLDRLVKKNGPLPVEQACGFIRQAALGLQHAFERGLVHRDIKPSNLIVAQASGRKPVGVLKILDMGLVHLARERTVSDRTQNTLTENGTLIGTPDYMSPEQIENPHLVDIRADIYSLGCSLYFLLTGRVCFPGCSLFQKILKIQQMDPTPVQELRPGLPPGLAQLINRMMAKNAQDRPQTPAEVVAGLTAILRQNVKGGAAIAKTRQTMDGTTQLRNIAKTSSGFVIPPPPVGRRRSTVTIPRPRGFIGGILGWFWRVCRSMWRWLGWKGRSLLIGSAGLMMLTCGLVPALLILRPSTSASVVLSPEDAMAKAWQQLSAQIDDPTTNPDQLRPKILSFRSTYPGTPLAQKAAEALMKLPSALDKLDAQNIPAEERLPEQPKELVAVLGKPERAQVTGGRMLFGQPSQTVAHLGSDNALHIWHLPTGQVRATLHLKGAVTGIALAADGRKAATIAPDRSVQIWDVQTGLRGPLVAGQTGDITAAAFDDRGEVLATASLDLSIKLWDATTGKLRSTLDGHRRPIRLLAFSPDGQTLASGGDDGVFKFWMVSAGKERGNGFLGNQPLRLLAFTPDGRRLITGGSVLPPLLWDLATLKSQFTLTGHADQPHAVAFAPDGQSLATASADQTIKIWDMATGQGKKTLTGLPSNVLALMFSTDGKTLTTWGQDQTLRQWEVSTGKQRGLLKGLDSTLQTVAIAPDGQTLATGSLGGSVTLWDAATAKVRITLPGHQMVVSAVAYAPDGRTLASASRDQTVKLYDLSNGQVIATLQGHSSFVTALAYGPTAHVLATGSADGAIKVWDTTTGKDRVSLRGHPGGVRAMAFSPDGQTLVSGGEDGVIRLWKWADLRELASLKDQVGVNRTVDFAPVGSRLASGDDSPNVRLWDVSANPPLPGSVLAGHTGHVVAVAFSLDGKLLATAGEDGRIIVWKPESGEKHREWQFSGTLTTMAFAPDGRHLATVNGLGSVYVWRIPPG